MSLVGKKAPLFVAPDIINSKENVDGISLKNIIGKKDIILFFYPSDNTNVIPPEILTFQKLFPEFERRNVAIFGVATDYSTSHFPMLTGQKKQGQIEGVPFPILRDMGDVFATSYGLRVGDWDYNDHGQLLFDKAPVEYRGMFLIDKKGIIRHECINFFPSIRNIYNILRVIDAWQYADGLAEKLSS